MKKQYFSCPRSRLRIWSCETGSAAPSRVSHVTGIPHTQLKGSGFRLLAAYTGSLHSYEYSSVWNTAHTSYVCSTHSIPDTVQLFNDVVGRLR